MFHLRLLRSRLAEVRQELTPGLASPTVSPGGSGCVLASPDSNGLVLPKGTPAEVVGSPTSFDPQGIIPGGLSSGEEAVPFGPPLIADGSPPVLCPDGAALADSSFGPLPFDGFQPAAEQLGRPTAPMAGAPNTLDPPCTQAGADSILQPLLDPPRIQAGAVQGRPPVSASPFAMPPGSGGPANSF